MGELRCVDGSVLSVTAVACRDRAGQPFEITLNLARDSVPFASIGQRCGHQLVLLAGQLTDARQDPEQIAAWPDPDDRFPATLASGSPSGGTAASPASPAGPRGQLGSYLPGETEYFALRSRDRADLPGSGELRCVLRSSAVWVGDCAGTGAHWPGKQSPHAQHFSPGQHVPPGQHLQPAFRDPAGSRGQWRLSRRAVIEAWGAGGIGLRAVLTSAELVAFLDTVLTGPEARALAGPESAVSEQASRSGGSIPYWRQRGRVPDATARTRLPALRAQARSGAHAPGDPQARWGDVRR
jgi:hypothetical protein